MYLQAFLLKAVFQCCGIRFALHANSVHHTIQVLDVYRVEHSVRREKTSQSQQQ